MYGDNPYSHRDNHYSHKCTRCGHTPGHRRQHCPADQAKCHKSVVATSLNIGEDPDEFLGVIQVDIATVPDWMIILSLNKCDLEFKIDRGADVTVIPEKLYTENRDGPLKRTTENLKGPVNRH